MERGAGVMSVRILLLVLFMIAVAAICLVAGGIRGLFDSAPDISDVSIMPMGNATFIYDSNGSEIQKLNSSDGNRVSVSIDEIPLNMQHAIVAVEDARFYEHHGIDPQGMLRALAVAVKERGKSLEGASTITQQLLKNNVFTQWTEEKTLPERAKRKVREQYLAVELEKSLKEDGLDVKSVILENYLNTVNFGSGAYGIQVAARTYFGKNSEDLTLSECAVLAAIPQNPSKYNPVRRPEDNAGRQKKVLADMLDQRYITKQQYDTALADDVYSRVIKQPEDVTDAPYSYFTDALITQLTQDLIERKGYTEQQAENAIYKGGLRVYTTQDSQIQQIMDEEYANPDNFPAGIYLGLDWALSVKHADGKLENYSREMMRKYYRENGNETFDLVFTNKEEAQAVIDGYKAAILKPDDEIVAERTSFTQEPQSAMVLMDQYTGQVKALIGGRGEKTASLTLNRATGTYRYPGSQFKILTTYGPSLDKGLITLASTLHDQPVTYSNGRPIENSDQIYRGNVSVRYAIMKSINTAAYRQYMSLGMDVGFSYLKKLGFDKLNEKQDMIEPTVLGGTTNGVTTLQMAGAFAAIANKGTYQKPILYTKVVDQDGEPLIDNEPVGKPVFKSSTAYLLSSAMSDVVNGNGAGEMGTAPECRIPGMHVAGKTGTTNESKDLSFTGFTPYYTAAIWAGYDSNAAIPEEFRTFQKILWQKIMARVHENLPDKEFEQPATVEKLAICKSTGLLANSGCPSKEEYFDVANEPKEHCTWHYGYSAPRRAAEPTSEPTYAPSARPTQSQTPDDTGEDESAPIPEPETGQEQQPGQQPEQQPDQQDTSGDESGDAEGGEDQPDTDQPDQGQTDTDTDQTDPDQTDTDQPEQPQTEPQTGENPGEAGGE